MSAFDVYKDYVALKNHFSKPNYDYKKYNGKSRLKQSSFDSRKDKLFFQKLAKREDYHEFLVANLSYDHRLWIRDIAYSEEADKRYINWKKTQQSLTYNYKSELSKLVTPFDDNFIISSDQSHPLLLKMYMGKEVSLETLCILLDITGAMKYWDKQMQYDPVWDEMKLKITKYTPFINYNKETFKKVTLDFFAQ